MEHGHGGAGVGGDAGGEDTEKMWKYQWTMSPLLRYMVVVAMVMVIVMVMVMVIVMVMVMVTGGIVKHG